MRELSLDPKMERYRMFLSKPCQVRCNSEINSEKVYERLLVQEQELVINHTLLL